MLFVVLKEIILSGNKVDQNTRALLLLYGFFLLFYFVLFVFSSEVDCESRGSMWLNPSAAMDWKSCGCLGVGGSCLIHSSR